MSITATDRAFTTGDLLRERYPTMTPAMLKHLLAHERIEPHGRIGGTRVYLMAEVEQIDRAVRRRYGVNAVREA